MSVTHTWIVGVWRAHAESAPMLSCILYQQGLTASCLVQQHGFTASLHVLIANVCVFYLTSHSLVNNKVQVKHMRAETSRDLKVRVLEYRLISLKNGGLVGFPSQKPKAIKSVDADLTNESLALIISAWAAAWAAAWAPTTETVARLC